MTRQSKKPRGPYRGTLNRPRRNPLITESEFAALLDATRAWFGISETDPTWKDKLLASVLIAHIPAFLFKPTRQRSVESEWIAEVMDEVQLKLKAEGKPATLDAVITRIKQTQAPDSDLDIASLSYERLKRIFGDRERMSERVMRRLLDQATRLAGVSAGRPPSVDLGLYRAYLEVERNRPSRKA